MLLGRNEHSADLLVGQELDGGVGEYAEECCRVAAEETTHTGLPVDVAHGGHDAEPGAGVFCELRVGGLEEDLNAVEGADDGFRRAPCHASCKARSEDIIQAFLVLCLASRLL